MTALQPCLAGPGTTSADPHALLGIQRIDLGAGAWLDHLPGWLTDDVEVFDALCAQVPWRQGNRVMYERTVDVPRLTAWCTDPPQLPHATLVRAFHALNRRYGPEPFEPLGCAGTATAGIRWHGTATGSATTAGRR